MRGQHGPLEPHRIERKLYRLREVPKNTSCRGDLIMVGQAWCLAKHVYHNHRSRWNVKLKATVGDLVDLLFKNPKDDLLRVGS